MNTILLGSHDTGKKPKNPKEFLKSYHFSLGGVLEGAERFRDDDRKEWRKFDEVPGNQVSDLQQFLCDAGFMPRGIIDGIFDYVTQAATRLFQEYIRTIEGVHDMVPDGIIGPKTWNHIEDWKTKGKVSEWGKASSSNPSEEYKKWMSLLHKAKTHYQQSNSIVLSQVSKFGKPSDTRKVSDWDFDPNEIHLIGIRRDHDVAVKMRENDDIYILLINGLVFKFWGSTDPNLKTAKHKPFLVEGQHKYKFGWHKISSKDDPINNLKTKVYRALRPYKNGVLVFRDRDNDNALTEADILKGIDPEPNKVINIHWTGIGKNWSAGCQVLAGESYINHLEQIVDCSGFAAANYNTLNSSGKKTKGAYNLCADLILSYARSGVDYIYYTLGRESSLNLDVNFGPNYALDILKKMKNK